MIRTSRETLTMSLLIAAITLLAAVGRSTGLATTLEAISFVTGALGVWLVVKQSAWNFPIGMLNVATFSVVFFEAKLYADAGLQVVYFVLTAIGWYMWLRGGENRTALVVTRAPRRELLVLAGLSALSTVALWRTLHLYGGSASLWDALTTSLSLAAQWLLNRKRLENWMVWILVDLIYVPLYVYKSLYLTALLYAVFLIMAAVGLKGWRQSMRLSGAPS